MSFLQERQKQAVIIKTNLPEVLHGFCFLAIPRPGQSEIDQIHTYLNGNEHYIPIEQSSDQKTLLIAKQSIVSIELSLQKIKLDPLVQKTKTQIMLHDKSQLECELSLDGPPGKQRISDILNNSNTFLEIWITHRLLFLNKQFVYKICL